MYSFCSHKKVVLDLKEYKWESTNVNLNSEIFFSYFLKKTKPTCILKYSICFNIMISCKRK